MNKIHVILLFTVCLVFNSCESNEIQPRIVTPGKGETIVVRKETVKRESPQEPNEVKAVKPKKELPEAAKAAVDGKTAEAGREAPAQGGSRPQDPNGSKTTGVLEKEPPEILKAALAEYKKAKSEAAGAEESLMREITGLIIEETMTRIGYDFYECFFMYWKVPQGIRDYNILITERANPMWGSWIQVEVNEIPVWNTVVKPRHDDVEEAAKNAVEAAKEYLRNYDVFRKQLQSEDMSGDGI